MTKFLEKFFADEDYGREIFGTFAFVASVALSLLTVLHYFAFH
jgi:hypothetical protein